jgi:hypothetical protein
MRAAGVAPAIALPDCCRQISWRMPRVRASRANEPPGVGRISGWSVSSSNKRSTPISAGGRRATRHLLVAVVPREQDVAPVDERQVAARAALLVGHRAQVGNRQVEAAALAVLHVAVRRRAVDRERHFVDARVREPARLRLRDARPLVLV